MHQIIFELVGGCFDGMTVCSDSDDPREAAAAHKFYFMSAKGKVGARFWSGSDYALEVLGTWPTKYLENETFQPHVYEVTDRLEGDGEVLIRAEYRADLSLESANRNC